VPGYPHILCPPATAPAPPGAGEPGERHLLRPARGASLTADTLTSSQPADESAVTLICYIRNNNARFLFAQLAEVRVAG
jgi:hypothetical protein